MSTLQVSAAAAAPENGRLLALPAGTVETVKWLALVLMVLDHVNTYLLGGAVHWMFAAGRTVMPLFSMVLAYNLARGAPGAAWRTARRALAFGVLATPAFWSLRGGWYPLNILFALAASAAVIGLLEQQRGQQAVLLGVAAGSLVEFWWPAIAATVIAWQWWKKPTWRMALFWLACIGALTPINGNAWALISAPIVASSFLMRGCFPRAKWLFYLAYPLHLYMVLIVRIVL